MSELTLQEKDQLAFHKEHDCKTTTHIGGGLSFGTGELDFNGFWERPCIYIFRIKAYEERGASAWHVADYKSEDGKYIFSVCNVGQSMATAVFAKYDPKDFPFSAAEAVCRRDEEGYRADKGWICHSCQGRIWIG